MENSSDPSSTPPAQATTRQRILTPIGQMPDDRQERIAEMDAHMWISPEYHSGLTGGLKNLFDYLAKEPMRGDVVGLCAIAGGAMAALNTLNGMSIIARSLGAWVAPDYCAFNADEVREGLDDPAAGRLDDLCATVVDMARRLRQPWPDQT